MPALSEIVSYCDQLLRIREIGDYENALNGLQIEKSGRVRKIASAVDASSASLEAAAKIGADFPVITVKQAAIITYSP